MAGWIKIDRNIRNHWIWSDPIKFQWWFDIIMTVNYEDKKVPIGYKLFLCKRGESLMSYNEWAKRWKVSKSVVYNFFTMLKNDEMISIKNETVTIRLTVCNYDSYQDNQNGNKTDEERIENASRTHRERKAYTTKEREEKKELEERKEEDIIISPEIKIKNEAFEKNNKADAWILKVDDKFKDTVSMYLDYRKGRKESYKTEKSFMLMVNNLIQMSGNNPIIAKQIVEQSMINNWAGLFELKQNNNKSYEQTAGKARKKLY